MERRFHLIRLIALGGLIVMGLCIRGNEGRAGQPHVLAAAKPCCACAKDYS